MPTPAVSFNGAPGPVCQGAFLYSRSCFRRFASSAISVSCDHKKHRRSSPVPSPRRHIPTAYGFFRTGNCLRPGGRQAQIFISATPYEPRGRISPCGFPISTDQIIPSAGPLINPCGPLHFHGRIPGSPLFVQHFVSHVTFRIAPVREPALPPLQTADCFLSFSLHIFVVAFL